MTLAGANRETWALIKDGVKVQVPDRERGGVKDERVRVVDWENPAENDFLLVSQMTVTGQLYTCRPDLVGFVNGLPWVVIELKKPGVPARLGFEENLTSYKHAQNGVPQLFACNAFMIASNGTQSRIGSITADWERFSEWKRIEREDEPRRCSRRARPAMGAVACSGRRRGRARASPWCSSRRRSCARCRATGPSWWSPTGWSSTIRSPRPSRPAAR